MLRVSRHRVETRLGEETRCIASKLGLAKRREASRLYYPFLVLKSCHNCLSFDDLKLLWEVSSFKGKVLFRTAVISAKMAMAISAGVWLPIDKPTGACNRANAASDRFSNACTVCRYFFENPRHRHKTRVSLKLLIRLSHPI